MAIQILSYNGQVAYEHYEFCVDSEADLAKLPVSPRVGVGSMALVISTSQIYILNSANEWVVI